jgi:hypothetical protein
VQFVASRWQGLKRLPILHSIDTGTPHTTRPTEPTMNLMPTRLAHLTMIVATLAAGVMAQPSQAAESGVRVVQLQTVVVTAKRIRTVQLEQVVVTAKRLNPTATTLLAQRSHRNAQPPATGRV